MAGTLEMLVNPHFPDKSYQREANPALIRGSRNTSNAGPSKGSQVLPRAFRGTEKTSHLHPNQLALHNSDSCAAPVSPMSLTLRDPS